MCLLKKGQSCDCSVLEQREYLSYDQAEEKRNKTLLRNNAFFVCLFVYFDDMLVKITVINQLSNLLELWSFQTHLDLVFLMIIGNQDD